ncbi:MAG: hypothetical protein E7029_00075 [Planctomycetaceae bacterium]|nr:hypothetical protein [Planctomycetaceae bacterium]
MTEAVEAVLFSGRAGASEKDPADTPYLRAHQSQLGGESSDRRHFVHHAVRL